MLLGNILKSVDKKYQKIPIKGISFDSRNVKKGNIFFAIKGTKTSGTKFIKKAIDKGASIIVVDRKKNYKKQKIPFLVVKNIREKLSEACANPSIGTATCAQPRRFDCANRRR